MNAETILDFVEKLIGPITPYGATHIDEKREENLKEVIEVATKLCENIKDVAEYRNDYRHSMKAMGQRAQEAVDELALMLNETDGASDYDA